MGSMEFILDILIKTQAHAFSGYNAIRLFVLMYPCKDLEKQNYDLLNDTTHTDVSETLICLEKKKKKRF